MFKNKNGINDNNVQIDNSGDVNKQKAKNNGRNNSPETNVNISFNPNESIEKLSRERIDLKSEIDSEVFDIIWNCRDCKKIKEEIIEELEKCKSDISEKYDVVGQLKRGEIYIQDPRLMIQEIDFYLSNWYDNENIEFCKNHKDKFKEIVKKKFRLKAIDETLNKIVQSVQTKNY